MDVNADTHAEPQPESHAQPNGESHAQPQAEPQAEPNGEPQVEPQAEPQAEPHAEPLVEPEVEPNVEFGPVSPEAAPPKKRRWSRLPLAARVAIIVVSCFVGFCLVTAGVVAGGLMTVRDRASVIMGDVSEIQQGMSSGDSQKIRDATRSIVESLHAMREATQNPFWAVASAVPVYGGDVTKAQQIFVALDELGTEVIEPLEDTLAGLRLDQIVQAGGVISVDALESIDTILQVAYQPLTRLNEDLQKIDGFAIDPIDEQFQKVKAQVAGLTQLVNALHEVTPLLPDALGAHGQTKNYLIGALNPSEQRPAGGLMGAWGLLSFTDGKATLGGFTPAAQTDFAVEFGDEYENSVLTKGMLLTPDFPHAAEIVTYVYQQLYGVAVDGFVAVDPIFLQDVLKVVGPITADNGMVVDGENASEVMLHEAYLVMTPQEQDKFFANVAGKAFQAIFSNAGSADLSAVVSAVTEGIEGHNLQIWMRNEDIQSILQPTGVTGELSRDATKPVLGVFDTDLTFSKIDWYIKFDTQVGEGVRNEDGSTTYPVTTTVTNTLTPDEVASLPDYVTGFNGAKREKGDAISMLTLWAPWGGSIGDVTYEGDVYDPPMYQELYGFKLVRCIAQDLPGQSTKLTYTVTTSPEATEPLTVRNSAKPRVIE